MDLSALLQASAGKRFVFLGEQHRRRPRTRKWKRESFRRGAGRQAAAMLVVGMDDVYGRPMQAVLDKWSSGTLTDCDFRTQSVWKHKWGYYYGFYRPVFEAVKSHHLPLVALNVPRDWVHAVGKSGFESLPTDARLQLPPQIYLDNREHRKVF